MHTYSVHFGPFCTIQINVRRRFFHTLAVHKQFYWAIKQPIILHVAPLALNRIMCRCILAKWLTIYLFRINENYNNKLRARDSQRRLAILRSTLPRPFTTKIHRTPPTPNYAQTIVSIWIFFPFVSVYWEVIDWFPIFFLFFSSSKYFCNHSKISSLPIISRITTENIHIKEFQLSVDY